jgi:hypothetical protein
MATFAYSAATYRWMLRSICAAGARRFAMKDLKEGLANALNAFFQTLTVVSVYSALTHTREVVPYKNIPNTIGENADRAQDWIAESIYTYFCTDGDLTFVMKLLVCAMCSSRKAMISIFKQVCCLSGVQIGLCIV